MSDTYDGGEMDDEELDVEDVGDDILLLACKIIELTLLIELVTLVMLEHMTSSKLWEKSRVDALDDVDEGDELEGWETTTGWATLTEPPAGYRWCDVPLDVLLL